MSQSIRILYVDDNLFDRTLVWDALEIEHSGFDLTVVASRAEFEAALAVGSFDLILSDFNILDLDGLQVINMVHAQEPDLPVIIVTGTGSESIAVEALKLGAADYIIKSPVHIRRLPLAIHAVLEKKQAERALRESRVQMEGIFNTMMDALITVDDDQIIIVFNPAAERMYRCKASEVIGQSLERFMPELAHQNHAAYVRSFGQSNITARSMETSVLALSCLRADGEPFASEVSISQLKIGGKKLFTAIVRDITERKQAEAALATEKNLLRTLIDHLPDSIYAKDAQGRFSLKNVAGARMLGAASPEETIGKSDFDYYAPEMAAEFYADDQKVIGGQAIFNHEELVTGATGRSIWVSTTKVPLRDHQGTIIGLVGIGHDITERRQADAHIELQLRRMSALHAIDLAIVSTLDLTETLDVILAQITTNLGLDAASVLLLDPDTQILSYVAGRGFYTSMAEKTAIHLGEEFLGPAVLDRRMIGAEEISQIKESPRLTALWAEEGFFDYHGIPLIAKDRIIGLLELFHRKPYPHEPDWHEFLEMLAGQAAIAVENATLFTETQAQVQLTQQIIDSTPEGIVLLDRAQRLVLANPTALAYLPDLAQLSAGDVVTSLGDHPFSAFLHVAADEQSRQELLLENPRRLIEVAIQSLTTGPHAGGKLLVIWDVTTERERQRYQQAQERLASVGQLAAGIAHDFNNIMGAIVLYAQLLSKAANLTKPQHSQLHTIQDQAKHASNLIRQILDFSRRSAMEKMALDLMPLIKEMTKLLERTLPENVRITLTYDQSEYLILADPTQLQQVLMNLSFNARDAMPNGGALHFALSVISLAPGETPPLPDMVPGDWVCLAVQDTGTGIDPDDLPYLFEPFFTTKAPGKGTGLGLAQVHGIVKQHDGSIIAKSQPGEGATFTIYLPLRSSNLEEMPAAALDEIGPSGGETILIVEDNEALRQSVQGALEDLGYRVLYAEDGQGAIQIFTQEADAISLMLSDLVMPEISGIELAQIVFDRHPKVKTLIMTGHPLGEKQDELAQANIAGWLKKPFSIAELAGTIRSVLDAVEPSPGDQG